MMDTPGTADPELKNRRDLCRVHEVIADSRDDAEFDSCADNVHYDFSNARSGAGCARCGSDAKCFGRADKNSPANQGRCAIHRPDSYI